MDVNPNQWSEFVSKHAYWFVGLALIVCLILTGFWIAFNLDFVNANQGAISLIFTVFIAASTFVYAILTLRLVSETIHMRKIQTEPKLSIIISPSDEWINFINLKIQNIGAGPAYNIKFQANPDFECLHDVYLSNVLRPINYLEPKEERKTFLTSLVEDFEKKISTTYEITASYSNKEGVNYKDRFIIDFSEFKGTHQLGEPPIYKIAKNLEKIESHFSSLSSGSKRIEVNAHTPEDVEREHKEEINRRKEFEKRARARLEEEKNK